MLICWKCLFENKANEILATKKKEKSNTVVGQYEQCIHVKLRCGMAWC